MAKRCQTKENYQTKTRAKRAKKKTKTGENYNSNDSQPRNRENCLEKFYQIFFSRQKLYRITETKITNIFSIKEFSMASQSSRQVRLVQS